MKAEALVIAFLLFFGATTSTTNCSADDATLSSALLAQEKVLAQEEVPAEEPTVRRGPAIGDSEQKALELVKLHLPELDGMLGRLRRDQNRQYDRAIRDLARWAKRLEFAKKRDAKLYTIEVEALKAESAANLLAAKLKVRDNEEDRHQLRSAVIRLHESRLARARYDVESSIERLERVKKQFGVTTERLHEIESDSESELEKTYLSLLKKAGRKP